MILLHFTKCEKNRIIIIFDIGFYNVKNFFFKYENIKWLTQIILLKKKKKLHIRSNKYREKLITYLNSISHQSSEYSIEVKCAEQN